MGRLARRPSPAMVVALAALFVSLGGVSYGFATGSIDSREVKDNSLRSGDLRNNDVRSLDIRNNEIRGRDIRNSTIRTEDIGANQVKGPDVLESSLGLVPMANVAGSLSSEHKINYQAAGGTGGQTIYDSGKLKLSATCGIGATLTVTASTNVGGATLQSSGQDAANDQNDASFETSETPTLSDSNEYRSLVYSEPGGQVVVIHYGAMGGATAGCLVRGVGQKL